MKQVSMWRGLAAWWPACLLALAVPAIAQDDPCQGRPLCQSPGPFVAEILQASPGMHGNNHHVRLVVRVRNTGAEPLVLGYVQDSGVMEDELGNRLNFFGMGLAGGQSAQALGRGVRRLLDGSK